MGGLHGSLAMSPSSRDVTRHPSSLS
ncbi:hypothetical protein F383_08467 [Gossypium arboreum]|uniref:Uncharacterized protein n=1 Tax=Gossypium arboreum TaxID=29729 RepID=A0A0B0PDF7_GOSAR|nr:hypothetical protein F383_08467 [Gossypium arboreum]